MKITALLSQQTTSVQNHPETDPGLWYSTLGHGFHIKHRDTGTLPIESPSHDAPWYVPNTLIRRDLQIPSVNGEITQYISITVLALLLTLL
jgi:hypothetical protein